MQKTCRKYKSPESPRERQKGSFTLDFQFPNRYFSSTVYFLPGDVSQSPWTIFTMPHSPFYLGQFEGDFCSLCKPMTSGWLKNFPGFREMFGLLFSPLVERERMLVKGGEEKRR